MVKLGDYTAPFVAPFWRSARSAGPQAAATMCLISSSSLHPNMQPHGYLPSFLASLGPGPRSLLSLLPSVSPLHLREETLARLSVCVGTRQDDFFGSCNATTPLAYNKSFLTADTGSRPEPRETVQAEYSGTPAWVDLLLGRPCLTSCSGWDWTLDLGRLLTTEFGKMPASLGFWSSCALCWPQCLIAQSAGAAFPGWQQEPGSLPQESALCS